MEETVVLNVGGVRYETYKSTLMKYPDSMLARMFAHQNLAKQNDKSEYFIDRNGRAFEAILDFYRTGELIVPYDVSPEVIKREIDFFLIPAKVKSSAKHGKYVQVFVYPKNKDEQFFQVQLITAGPRPTEKFKVESYEEVIQVLNNLAEDKYRVTSFYEVQKEGDQDTTKVYLLEAQ
eukprot:TRINITY_DN7406_c0_g1_i1.p1 TRINITY_DN7406_c0_g1~~TRINITY_DN7406_c0_g1_i1.p1  ORF type:complete len:177 (-),score=18.54 TRINITY_DN7406_c0_g1_i1:129-659(-)